MTGTLNELNKHIPLISLQLSHNHFSGTIPKSYREKRFLELDLRYNKFTSTIPNEISVLTKLQTFFLRYNSFSGFSDLGVWFGCDVIG